MTVNLSHAKLTLLEKMLDKGLIKMESGGLGQKPCVKIVYDDPRDAQTLLQILSTLAAPIIPRLPDPLNQKDWSDAWSA